MAKSKMKITLELDKLLIQKAEMELAHIVEEWRIRGREAVNQRANAIQDRFAKQLADKARVAIEKIVEENKAHLAPPEEEE